MCGEHLEDFDHLSRRVRRFGVARFEHAYDARSHDEGYRDREDRFWVAVAESHLTGGTLERDAPGLGGAHGESVPGVDRSVRGCSGCALVGVDEPLLLVIHEPYDDAFVA